MYFHKSKNYGGLALFCIFPILVDKTIVRNYCCEELVTLTIRNY